MVGTQSSAETVSVNRGMDVRGTIYFATCDEWLRGVYPTQEHVTILEEYLCETQCEHVAGLLQRS